MTYKPDSDDLRESPAIVVAQILRNEGYEVHEFDNYVKGHEYEDIEKIAMGADCIVVLVEHSEIKEELQKREKDIKAAMRNPLILRIGTSYKPDTYDLTHSRLKGCI